MIYQQIDNFLELLMKKENLKQALIFLIKKYSQDTQNQNSQSKSENKSNEITNPQTKY